MYIDRAEANIGTVTSGMKYEQIANNSEVITVRVRTLGAKFCLHGSMTPLELRHKNPKIQAIIPRYHTVELGKGWWIEMNPDEEGKSDLDNQIACQDAKNPNES